VSAVDRTGNMWTCFRSFATSLSPTSIPNPAGPVRMYRKTRTCGWLGEVGWVVLLIDNKRLWLSSLSLFLSCSCDGLSEEKRRQVVVRDS
jgi:hypothetical protein